MFGSNWWEKLKNEKTTDPAMPYHKERSVDDQEVVSYNNYLEVCIKELRGYFC